jgi:carbonic anhydrase/acetyltransferase-like protein (isoleucine patch superfamily)|tara:strand:- start:391 stop:918 length:528 start_codon:yes stop_codon:yes gene_type:complete
MKYDLGEYSVDTEGEDFFIAENATVIGRVKLCKDVSVWFGAVLRGDFEHITIGEGSNVQDCCVVHTELACPVEIGKNVTVGHHAIIHGCTIGDRSLIGINAVILNGAKIGSDCLIASNALVPEGAEIPDGSLVMGSPGRIKGTLDEGRKKELMQSAQNYIQNYKRFKSELKKKED